MKTEIKFPGLYTPKLDNYNDNGYYDGCVDYQVNDRKGKLLFWLLFEEEDYFTIPLRDEVYKSCTPFIYIERTSTNHFFFENDKDIEDMLKYPHTISTIGCDDGHKGWRFETKEQLEAWVMNFIQDALNINKKNSFEYPSEFLDYYEENQVWRN
jgi:hypothetical protein